MVRRDDDPRVVVHVVFPQIVQPAPDLDQRGHVDLIVLHLRGHGHMEDLSVQHEAVRVRGVIFGVFHDLRGLISRLAEERGLVRGAVCEHQERIPLPVRDLGHLRQRAQHGVGAEEAGIDPARA